MWKWIRKLPEERAGLLWLLLISAFWKAGLALSGKVINPDGMVYLQAARQISEGRVQEAIQLTSLPLYPTLIALFHVIIPDWLWAARSISLVCTVLVLVPLYLLTRDLFGRRAAFWAGLAGALAPPVNDWALDVIRNPPFVLCMLWAVHFSQRALLDGKALRFLAASALGWLAVLFRIEGIVMIPAFALFLLWAALWGGEGKRRHALKGLALWLGLPVGIFLCLFPFLGQKILTANRLDQVYYWACALGSGSFFESYRHIYAQMKALEAASAFPGGKQNFAETARHMMPLIYLLGLLRALSRVLFEPFLLPLFWAFKRPWTRGRRWVLFLVCIYLLAILADLLKQDFLEYRFLLAPALLLYPWVGNGTARLLERFGGMGGRGTILAWGLVLFLIIAPLGKGLKNVSGEDHAIRWAGHWFRTQGRWKKARVVTNDMRVALYAGRSDWREYDLHARGPMPDMEGLERFALQARADLVVVRLSRKDRRALSLFRHFTERVALFEGPKRLVVVMAPRPSPPPCSGGLDTVSSSALKARITLLTDRNMDQCRRPHRPGTARRG